MTMSAAPMASGGIPGRTGNDGATDREHKEERADEFSEVFAHTTQHE
jgi:hypothetical protein